MLIIVSKIRGDFSYSFIYFLKDAPKGPQRKGITERAIYIENEQRKQDEQHMLIGNEGSTSWCQEKRSIQ